MPSFDVHCDKCGHRWGVTKKYAEEAPECVRCGSNFTRTLMPLMKHSKAKDPYDYIIRPPGKPIKSFSNDRRLKGKDTT